MSFAVVGCSRCRNPWVVELRHTASRCPACGTQADLARRTRLWQGDDARQAQAAAARLRAGADQPVVTQLADHRPVTRHDDPLDAAAAKASAVVNKSQKAELVALWLTRLVGDASHADYMTALTRAGLAHDRAEQEIVRMLAMDVIFEPRAGHYRLLG